MHTVLIVEDDLAIAEMLQELLKDEGYSVAHANDGQEALEILDRQRCDLIIADLMMPRLDGRELRAAAAQHPVYAHIPIVLMTAGINLIAHDQHDFAAVLPKPFHLDTVVETVARLVNLPSP